MYAWGAIIQGYYGTTRLPSVTLSDIGYYTDDGTQDPVVTLCYHAAMPPCRVNRCACVCPCVGVLVLRRGRVPVVFGCTDGQA